MQPIIAVIARIEGILYLNGHLAGEVAPDQPLLRPVSARGALILEYKPFDDDYRPMARRLVFANGMPLPASAEAMAGAKLALWSAGVTEIELSPSPAGRRTAVLHTNGQTLFMEGETLFREGAPIARLPDGAEIPEAIPLANGAALRGKCAEGTYLLSFDSNFSVQTGALIADEIHTEGDGGIHLMRGCGDLTGHGTLEIWRHTSEGLVRIASESMWTGGAPNWPQTPSDTARAFVEACLLGLDGEAEGYCAPALRGRIPFEEIRRRGDSCTEMRYVPSDARPGVALVKLEGENLARVTPMRYSFTASGSIQGPYKLEAIFFDDGSAESTREFNTIAH